MNNPFLALTYLFTLVMVTLVIMGTDTPELIVTITTILASTMFLFELLTVFCVSGAYLKHLLTIRSRRYHGAILLTLTSGLGMFQDQHKLLITLCTCIFILRVAQEFRITIIQYTLGRKTQ